MSSTPTSGSETMRTGSDSWNAADGARLTPIGVDVGSTRNLFAAVPATGDPSDAVVAEAHYVQALFSEFQSATHRLGAAPAADPDGLGDIVARYWPRLRSAFERAADVVLEYAAGYPAPILVVEELSSDPRPLIEAAYGDMRGASWIPAVSQAILVERAVTDGLPVSTVDPHETSSRCHHCNERAELSDDVLGCQNGRCPVGEVCRDRSAAISIAARLWEVQGDV